MTFDLTRLPDDFIDNPHPHYAALRESDPVYEMPGGGLFLSRHADLVRVYKDRDTFSSDKKVEFYPKFGDSLLYQHHTTSLVFNDAPLHTRVRRAIAGALAPRAIAGMDVVVQQLVDGLIDDLAARQQAGKPIDAVAHFAQNIPIEVIGNLLAIPRAERAPLRDWSLAILGALEPEISPQQFEEGETAVREFLASLEALVARRRGEGLDEAGDIMARLIRETGAAGEDANLLPHELLQNCIFILNAGHETTTNLICSGIFLLAGLPQIVAHLADNPNSWPAAIEEILRMESPNQLGNRRAVAAFEMGGRRWSAGTLITLGMGAANRDPAVFDRPDEFRLDRGDNPHLAFAGGVHVCAGNSIARIEGQIALASLFRRWPDLRVAAGMRRSPRVRFRGFELMPLRLAEGA
ncbi:MAG: cytochrome P450 [Pseudomonadota bacterium]|nr:cytochrome P450 [Pseudomonadota bacterium]